MRVKICGICRPEDARAAAVAGADYVGVVLAPTSRRAQSAAAAAAIFEAAGSCRRVGVFADQPLDEVCASADALALHVVQLHGSEDAAFAAAVAETTGRAVWKTVWPDSELALAHTIRHYTPYVAGLLLDGARGIVRGGSGQAFDWAHAAGARGLLPAEVDLIVAGGLTAENVRSAIAVLRPDVVDVASGVEASLCVKDNSAMQAFVRNAKT